jgi:nucleoside-diphosphate-sugar epimerase
MTKTILITGITGTLGTELTKQILATKPDTNIIGLSRDEQKQQAFFAREHQRVRLVLSDICNMPASLVKEPITHIIHTAALKCQPLLEANPSAAIRTNIYGTEEVIGLARILGARLLFASSDKAVYPINVYGNTKAIGEALVLNAGKVVVRYGNIIGSRGSFLPMLVKSLLLEKTAYLTDAEMTRFWLPIEQVASFILRHLDEASGVYIPEMISSTVAQLIHATAEILGTEYVLKFTGMRPGEKLHESITANKTSNDDKADTSALKALIFGRVIELAREIRGHHAAV